MDAQGLNRFAARRKLEEVTDDQVDEIVHAKCVEFEVVPPLAVSGFGAIGDGTIIQGIKDFCDAHPELISAIVKALLLLVMV